MAIGSITSKASLNRAKVGRTASWAKGNGNIWLLGYNEPGTYNVIFETYEIDPVTGVFGPLLDTLNTNQIYSDITFMEQLYEGVVGCWWNNADFDGKITTLGVSAAGSISLLTSIEYKDCTGDDRAIAGYNVLNISTGVFAFAYGYKLLGAWAYSARICTISVSSAGALLGVLQDTEVVTDSQSPYNYMLAYHTGTVYALAATRTVYTFSLSADGLIISSAISSSTFGTAGITKSLLKCGNGWWIVTYAETGTNDGFHGSFQISDAGAIDAALTNKREFETGTMNYPSTLSLGTDGSEISYFITNYMLSNGTGSVVTCKVTSLGALSGISSFVWNPTTGTTYSAGMLTVAYNMFLVHGDSDSGDDIYSETLEVEAVPPPTVTGIVPDSGKVNRTLDVVISGTDLGTATAVDMGAGITVEGIAVINDTTINVTITIGEDAVQGYRDVTVTNPSGSGVLSNGFYVFTTENHYFLTIGALEIPYIDEDGSKELHARLTNLSSTEKTSQEDGEVVLEISYRLEG